MRKVNVAAKWTWASSVIVMTDGVSVPRFVPLSPLVFCAFQHGDGLWAKVLCHLVSRLVEFAPEDRRVRQGVHSLSLPVYQHLG